MPASRNRTERVTLAERGVFGMLQDQSFQNLMTVQRYTLPVPTISLDLPAAFGKLYFYVNVALLIVCVRVVPP